MIFYDLQGENNGFLSCLFLNFYRLHPPLPCGQSQYDFSPLYIHAHLKVYIVIWLKINWKTYKGKWLLSGTSSTYSRLHYIPQH